MRAIPFSSPVAPRGAGENFTLLLLALARHHILPSALSDHRTEPLTRRIAPCARPAPRSTRKRSDALPRAPRHGGIPTAAFARSTNSTPRVSALFVNTWWRILV